MFVDHGPATRFFLQDMPRLVAANRLIVQVTEEGKPLVFVRHDLNIPHLRHYPIPADSKLFASTVADMLAEDGLAGKDLEAVRKSAYAAMNNVYAWTRRPDLTVKHIFYHPSLIYRNGRYESVPRGHCPTLRTHCLVDPIHPGPLTGRFVTFLDHLRLPAPDRARLVAFLAGVVLRPNFGPFPGLLLRSPFKGSGKTTVGCFAGALLLGEPRNIPTMSWRGTTEFDKELGSHSGSCPFFFLDNVDCSHSFRTGRRFFSETICTAIARGRVSSRLLGVSQMICIDRPVFVVTMQRGVIDHDLADRFLDVNFAERPPESGTAPDIAVMLNEHWAEIRGDLYNLISQTVPDPTTPYFRYAEFFQHVAPVIRAMGLDDTALNMTVVNSARADVLELFQLLAKRSTADPNTYWTAGELLEPFDFKWPALAALVPDQDSSDARKYALRTLLNKLPTTYEGPEHFYALKKRETRDARYVGYRVETTARPDA